MDAIHRTIAKQGDLFVKPFWDVGYVGCNFHVDRLHYLDQPLVVLGEPAVKAMHGSLLGQRMRWSLHVPFLEFSPLKACTFVNMGAESHLKVLYGNGIDRHWDCSFRSDFYLRHLEEIATDNPWTITTERDIEEAMPYAVAALHREKGFRQHHGGVERELRKWIDDKRTDNHSKDVK